MRKLEIDNDYIRQILLELLAIPSPVGFTDEVVHYTGHKLRELGIPFELTRRGAIRATIKGSIVVAILQGLIGGLVFPMFAAQRLASRVRSAPADERLPSVSTTQDRILRGLCHAEASWLRRLDLPFGSSVLVAAVKRA